MYLNVLLLHVRISVKYKLYASKGLIYLNSSTNKKLMSEIEETRMELVCQMEKHEINNNKIIEISQNLDKLIAEYMKKSSETKKHYSTKAK